MKDQKTTIAGIIAGLPVIIGTLLQSFNAGQFDGKSAIQIIVAIALILGGYYSQDVAKKVDVVAPDAAPVSLAAEQMGK